jgi:hypothetical protein
LGIKPGLLVLVYVAAMTYLGLGAVVAAAFLLLALDRIDPAARHAWAFRPLIVPGLILLWPLVVWRWMTVHDRPPTAEKQTRQRQAHALIWVVLSVLLPLVIATGYALRLSGTAHNAPVRIGMAVTATP